MEFSFGEPTAVLTLEDQRKWIDTFRDVTFACPVCMSEDTKETSNLVPAGTHHMVLCVNGHETVGIPPRRFREPAQA